MRFDSIFCKLGIALVRMALFASEQGQLPTTLADLPVPTGKSRLLDPTSGSPLEYRVNEREVVIYGRGVNNVDDHGKIDGPSPPDVGIRVVFGPAE